MFGWGWPKLLAAEYDGSAGEDWLYLCQDPQYMVAVSPSAVQLWCTGLQKVRLSQVVRDKDSLQSEGANRAAVWCPAKSTLAVVTDANFLHLYTVHVWSEMLMPGSSTAAGSVHRVDIYLRSSSRLEAVFPCTSITADARLLLLGFANGSLATYAWSGKLKELAHPLAEDDALEAAELAGVFDSPALVAGLDAGGGPLADEAAAAAAAVVDLHYCDRSKKLALVLAGGPCALLSASFNGLGALGELVLSHWVCTAAAGARTARIGASAQLLAVGLASAEVALYRLHRVGGSGAGQGAGAAGPQGLGADEGASPSVGPLLVGLDAPVRTLSLAPWGHTLQQTGGVSKLEWSPDSRAIAVGYAASGVVVWSPSGCRLLCSLPQTSGLALAASPSAAAGAPDASPRPQPSATPDALELGRPLEGGVAALSWGHLGYQLVVAEVGSCQELVEMQFARSLPSHHRVAHSGPHGNAHHSSEELHVLQAHDRLLVIGESVNSSGLAPMSLLGLPVAVGAAVVEGGGGNDLLVSHVPAPAQYISANWPLQHAAISSNGLDIAVAGRRGLALYSRAADKWRLFGDVSQERQVACRALCWLHSVVVCCSGPSTDTPGPLTGPQGGAGQAAGAPAARGQSSGYELLLFPRYHLDMGSVLCRLTLSQAPVAMDCVGNHILLASAPLEIALMEVEVQGPLNPLAKPKAKLHLIREISMLDIGRPLLDVALVAPPPASASASASASSSQLANQGQGSGSGAPQPALRQCVLLRWGGLMSVLDLERGTEMALSTDVEAFWLSDSLPSHAPLGSRHGSLPGPLPHSVLELGTPRGADAEATPTGTSAVHDLSEVEMPWWAYGPQGMQLWFPSSLTMPLAPRPGLGPGEQHHHHQDIELEFDEEVYPVGISLADAAIIGVTQRVVRGVGAGSAAPGMTIGRFPSFHPVPESQPVLPCLLRRLLQRGAFAEALSLARRHELGPHFTRSLEWLLFTALEMEASRPLSKRTKAARAEAGGVQGQASPPDAAPPLQVSPLLSSAAHLVRHFSSFADIVVSVARKTDAALWPPLFAAVGSPSALLDMQLQAGALTAAACLLLVIDRLEGAPAAHAQTLRLMRASLRRGQYVLVAELLRFVEPPGREEDAAAYYRGSDMGQDLTPEAALQPAGDRTASAGGGAQQQEQPAAQQGWFGWLFGRGQPATHAQQGPASGAGPSARTSRAGSSTGGAGAQPQPQQQPPAATAARRLVAEHAWGLLEQGRLRPLVHLAAAVAWLPPTGLAGVMQAVRDSSAYACGGHACVEAVDLITAVQLVVQELPVWDSEELEAEAHVAHALCTAVGARAWAVALAVALVDTQEVAAFMKQHPVAWQQFAALVRSDASFAYLWEILDLHEQPQQLGGQEAGQVQLVQAQALA